MTGCVFLSAFFFFLHFHTHSSQQLLEFFPASKRNDEFFSRHFGSEGLKDIATFYEKRVHSKQKSELVESLTKMIAEPLPFAEAVAFLKQQKAAYTEAEAITIIWSAIMGSVDWSRKPEQYEEQALKSTKVCGPSLKS